MTAGERVQQLIESMRRSGDPYSLAVNQIRLAVSDTDGLSDHQARGRAREIIAALDQVLGESFDAAVRRTAGEVAGEVYERDEEERPGRLPGNVLGFPVGGRTR